MDMHTISGCIKKRHTGKDVSNFLTCPLFKICPGRIFLVCEQAAVTAGREAMLDQCPLSTEFLLHSVNY